jgi:hypothetical protein
LPADDSYRPRPNGGSEAGAQPTVWWVFYLPPKGGKIVENLTWEIETYVAGHRSVGFWIPRLRFESALAQAGTLGGHL